jgi:hypothetical protein
LVLIFHTMAATGLANAQQASDWEIQPIEKGARVAVLVPIRPHATWRDQAFLMAIPAAMNWGNGDPIVLAVSAEKPFRPEVIDFLQRFAPTRLLWLGPEAPAYSLPGSVALEPLEVNDLVEASLATMLLGWPEGSEQIVMFDPREPESALVGSALAARLRVPLYPCRSEEFSEFEGGFLSGLGVKEIILVGGQKAPKVKPLKLQQLKTAEDAVRWLVKKKYSVDYLAAVNVRDDAAGRNRNLALVAPLLAAGRNGMVLPLNYDTLWKRPFEATEAIEANGKKPSGSEESSEGWQRGTIDLDHGKKPTPFGIGRNASDGRWWMQLDRNRDGRFQGKREKQIFTGDEFELEKTMWMADLDAVEAERGKAVWITSPTSTEIQKEIQRFHKAAKGQPQYLCLVGWPDALPMAVISHGQGIDTDLVSDLPYTQLDEDPFFELAHARFIAEDQESATLLACRGFARDDMPDRSWANNFATAEWEDVCRPSFEAAGFTFGGHHEGGEAFVAKSPLTNAGLIVHASHAMWTVMGETYAWNTDTLLAPALVESAGCSTASLDQDAERRSVASRLLKNGAVAFVGNSRRGIAQQELFRSEFWNALLANQTIGQAQRTAQNRVLVATLEKGQGEGGAYFYQLNHHMVLGDPALQLGLQQPGAEVPATFEQDGNKVTLTAPPKWHRSEYIPLEEWGCEFPKLWAWRGAGVGVESTWYNPQKRNAEEHYFNVEARTRKKFTNVEVLSSVLKTPEESSAKPNESSANLGWTGSCFVDKHADGSRSLYWRVRLLDADKTTGGIRAQIEQMEFRLVSD